jgi:hypothetical protein
MSFTNVRLTSSVMLLATLLVGCSNTKVDNDEEILSRREKRYKDMDKLLGNEALVFSPSKKSRDVTVGIGVNTYLWRASLDTIAFMPLLSADPFGGVILTDWYSSPSTPTEQFKVDIRILDRQLRADGLRVSVFKKVLRGDTWVDAPVSENVAKDIENAILTRARQLKVNS